MTLSDVHGSPDGVTTGLRSLFLVQLRVTPTVVVVAVNLGRVRGRLRQPRRHRAHSGGGFGRRGRGTNGHDVASCCVQQRGRIEHGSHTCDILVLKLWRTGG